MINETGEGLVDLWEASPVRLEDNDSHTEEIIDALFPGNPLLCVGKSKAVFATQSREEWRGKLTAMQLIVPSPMLARTGRTQDGKESEHTLEATGSRRFLVVEFDTGGIDEHAALLRHLAEYAPNGYSRPFGEEESFMAGFTASASRKRDWGVHAPCGDVGRG